MEIIDQNDSRAIHNAVEILKAGGIVIYPTETAYGLGVDARNKEAVEKLYELKKRPIDKPTHVLVADMSMAEEYVALEKNTKQLVETFWPGPLTLVCEKKEGANIYVALTADADKWGTGIRVPGNVFTQELVRACGFPITTPSANKAGAKIPYTIQDALDTFGEDGEKIDLVIDGGRLAEKTPSTLIDVREKSWKMIREGAISKSQIIDVIGQDMGMLK